MAKCIMHEFRIDEISAVTKPAQKGAKALIMKREDGATAKASPDPKKVEKGITGLTEPNFGHAHSFRLDHYTLATGGGETDFRQNDLEDGSHSHPFVINADGTIEIGMSAGHDHEVEGTVEDILLGTIPDTDGDSENEMAADAGGELDDSAMKAAGSVVKATGDIEMDEKEVAELRALASMTDVQKAHFAKLDAGDKESFVKMSASERKAALEKARENDPVVYKSTSTGREFRASDNPELLALAKSVDGLTAALSVTKAQSEEKEVDALVAKLAHLGKPIEEKRLLAKSILGIADEKARALAIDGLMAGKETVEKLFTAIGVPNVGNGILASANEELSKMAQDRATATGESFHKAYDVVLRTPRGKQLYAETIRPN